MAASGVHAAECRPATFSLAACFIIDRGRNGLYPQWVGHDGFLGKALLAMAWPHLEGCFMRMILFALLLTPAAIGWTQDREPDKSALQRDPKGWMDLMAG